MTQHVCNLNLNSVTVLLVWYRKQRTSTSMKIQKNFAVTQIFILVPFLAGIFRTSPDGACQAVAAVLHFGLLSAVLWLAIEAITFYVEQTRMLGITWNTNITKRFLLAWGDCSAVDRGTCCMIPLRCLCCFRSASCSCGCTHSGWQHR